ncbi:MAG: hypothetical protein HFACDABA_02019 [Anaerolineales bacterium]|nr:hypothetical protein [Anaerolineales bacterium]
MALFEKMFDRAGNIQFSGDVLNKPNNISAVFFQCFLTLGTNGSTH